MNKNIDKIAELLQLSIEDLQKYKNVIDNELTYYWNPKRGGLHLILNTNGEKLEATSQISFDRLLTDFKNGKRN